MAIGYPDFYSYQILEQYNVIQSTIDYINPITANDETEIFNITGKGKIKRFRCLFSGFTNGDSPQINCYVDGAKVQWGSLSSSLDAIVEKDNLYDFSQLYADINDSLIILEHKPDIIFFESLQYTILTGVGETGSLISLLEYFEPNPQIVYAPI